MEKILERLQIKELNAMQQAALAVPATKDLILLSPTGSGKTLAFLLPLLKCLKPSIEGVQALVVVPSRELALQIEQVFKQMGTGFKANCCYGGHSTRVEKNNLSHPPALLIGTPGRIAYHLENLTFKTNTIKTLVLDEFDKALEFGFQKDMSFIIDSLGGLDKRILTSATAMEEIPDFTGIKDPERLNYILDVPSQPQLKLKAVLSSSTDKLDTLFALICRIGNKPTLVFSNHRDAVDRISSLLAGKGLVHGVFHGGMEQEDRERALLKFRNGSHNLLITTDLASRGLDIPEIEYIVHYQLPNEEAFIHRNGRTARMHAKGTAYLILNADEKTDYINYEPTFETLPQRKVLPPPTDWDTLYIAAGKKDKVNKIDIVGLLMQKGALEKDELGRIEVLDHSAYAAVKRSKIAQVLNLIKNEKIKNKKVKIAIAS